MMLNDCNRPCSAHYFDDLTGIAHGVLGWLAAYSGYGPAVAAGFIAYQMSEVESVSNKLGDIGEFVTGYLLREAFGRRRL